MGANANRQAVQKLRDCARSSGAFANFELLGSYDDFSQVVSIEYLDKDDFMGLLERFRLARGSRGMQKAELQANYEAIANFTQLVRTNLHIGWIIRPPFGGKSNWCLYTMLSTRGQIKMNKSSTELLQLIPKDKGRDWQRTTRKNMIHPHRIRVLPLGDMSMAQG
ncbi:hypothetical protein [Synechococcus sp. UW140]|uniref:hypothetical protein n=1 Tax=Synechococcus sp. UW140 TaxID=368503 RepID=UPI003137935C